MLVLVESGSRRAALISISVNGLQDLKNEILQWIWTSRDIQWNAVSGSSRSDGSDNVIGQFVDGI